MNNRKMSAFLVLIMVLTFFKASSQCFVKQNEGDIFRNFAVFNQTFRFCGSGSLDQINLRSNASVFANITVEVFFGASLDPNDLLGSKVFEPDEIGSYRITPSSRELIFNLSDLNINLTINTLYTFKVSSDGQGLSILKSENDDVYPDGSAGFTTIGDLTGEDWAFTVISDPKPEIGFITYQNAFDISHATFSESAGNPVSVSTIENNARGFYISPDGLKIYITGLSDQVYQFDLPLPFDIASADFTVGSAESLDLSVIENNPLALQFSHDGTRLFVSGRSGRVNPGNNIYYYSCSTPFDITTATLNGTYDAENRATAFAFSNDGRILYHADGTSILRIDLNTPYDLESAALNGRNGYPIDLSSVLRSVQGINFSPDGRLFIVCDFSTGKVVSYSLSSPFNLSTATIQNVLTVSDIAPQLGNISIRDISYSSDGSKLILLTGLDEIVSIDLDAGVFLEALNQDDGSISGSIQLSIAGETFADAGALIPSNKFTITNLPQGLSPQIQVSPDGDAAILTLTGNALNQDNDDGVDNLFINFDRTAFTSGVSDLVLNGTSLSGIKVLFNDPPFVWDGSQSDKWSDPDNWQGGSVPVSGSDVLIPDQSIINNMPVIPASENVEIDDLFIDINSGITIKNSAFDEDQAGILTVAGDFTHMADPMNTDSRVIIESGSVFRILGNRLGNGTQRFERNLKGSAALSTFGTPMTSVRISDLHADFVFDFDESANDFNIPSSLGLLHAGRGLFIGSNATTYKVAVEGQLQTGIARVPITNQNGGYNLLANPYAAPIQYSKLVNDLNNEDVITGTVWIWNDGLVNSGDKRGGAYLTVSRVGSTSFSRGAFDPIQDDGISGAKSIFDFDGHIAAGQAFFVRAKRTDREVVFNPAMQSTTDNADGFFFRGNTPVSLSLSLLYVKDGEYISKNTIVGFTEDQSENKTGAELLESDMELDFYSWMEDKKMTIQTFPNEISDLKLELGFDVEKSGHYLLRFDEATTSFLNRKVYLFDRMKDQEISFQPGDTYSFYTHQALSEKRFALRFSNLSVVNAIESNHQKDLLRILSLEEHNLRFYYKGHEDVIAIYDLQGRLIAYEQIKNKDEVMDLPVNLESGQVYLIKVGSKTERIFLKN
ncbi:MAG: hypothetical protein AAFQ94_02240 [Bacteroidota bacterium]